MKTNTTKIVSLALMALTLSFSSCKKEETAANTPSEVAKVESFKIIAKRQVQLNAFNIKLSSQLQEMLMKTSKYMKKEDDGIESPMGCAIVTIDSSSSPRIATFDFGSGCTDSTGKYYEGVITIEYISADLSAPGSTMDVTFNNFLVDSISYDGTFNYTNTGINGNGNPSGTIATSGTTTFIHDRMRLTGDNNATFEVITARSTAYVTFSGSGTDHNGIVFSQSTNTPMEFKNVTGCQDHFTSGKLLIQSPSLPDEEIDYGSGTCDNLATSTILGVPTTFTLE